MKVLAYTPLHYGKQYLKQVIESVKDHVDEHLILYTEKPSYGHASNLQNPDSKQELKSICDEFEHVTWLDVTANQENAHRQQAFNYARGRGVKIVLAVDSDEIWNPDYLQSAINKANLGKSYQYGVNGNNWVTFWKSTFEYVQDGFYPIRLFNLANSPGSQEVIGGDGIWIYHMGYCISDELMQYKLSCHGHKSEIPTNWFKDKWLGYVKGETKYLHPATDAYWIETKNTDFYLPECLKK